LRRSAKCPATRPTALVRSLYNRDLGGKGPITCCRICSRRGRCHVELAVITIENPHGAVKQTPITERATMGYIINLTILLKGLFQGLHSERQAVRRVIMADSIDTVVDAYEQSGERAQRHRDIDESVPHPSCIFSPGHRRKRLQEIFRLIEIYVLHRGMQHKVGHGHSEGPGLHAVFPRSPNNRLAWLPYASPGPISLLHMLLDPHPTRSSIPRFMPFVSA
ncbi:hypothetical protein FRB94_002864, partial [Tulasnella sp. JGI-2019a]